MNAILETEAYDYIKVSIFYEEQTEILNFGIWNTGSGMNIRENEIIN